MEQVQYDDDQSISEWLNVSDVARAFSTSADFKLGALEAAIKAAKDTGMVVDTVRSLPDSNSPRSTHVLSPSRVSCLRVAQAAAEARLVELREIQAVQETALLAIEQAVCVETLDVALEFATSSRLAEGALLPARKRLCAMLVAQLEMVTDSAALDAVLASASKPSVTQWLSPLSIEFGNSTSRARARVAEVAAEGVRRTEREGVGLPAELETPAEFVCPLTQVCDLPLSYV